MTVLQEAKAWTERGATAAVQNDVVLVLDFGSQYSQLIARRIREAGVYSELVPATISLDEIRRRSPSGLVFSGGPASVDDPDAPRPDPRIYELTLPILGICYGMQLLASDFGGNVRRAGRREYGRAGLSVDNSSLLFRQLPADMNVWMSHGDEVETLPPGFHSIAQSDNAVCAAMADDSGHIGIQFHPEVAHTEFGKTILDNFLFSVCGCEATWEAEAFVETASADIRAQVGSGRVICGLSGGVDSSVVAALVHRAVGDQLTCVFVDNGLLRKGEAEQVLVMTAGQGMRVVCVDAKERFLAALEGTAGPEEKRRRIGHTFIDVFETAARELGDAEYLAQGTLYPDVIESTSHDTNNAVKIKSHHNVGGLPENLSFKLVEPLRYLFKDEVRRVGIVLGLPEEMVWRQPFPGPGLAIRIMGEVTEERLETVRAANAIVEEEIKKSGLERNYWQYLAVLTLVASVGVMGDGRSYDHVVAVRVVESQDGMTADWSRVSYDVLASLSSRLVNEVPGISRVVYDITSKPPATIEWE
jgi:GMP synthase (glutamine-hydrolysing)